MDNYPHANIFTTELLDLLEHCRTYSEIQRIRTLDRHNFLSRKQKQTNHCTNFETSQWD